MQIDHELTMVLMHLGKARHEARVAGDVPLAESIEAVQLQADDLFSLNALRAAREQMARDTAAAMVERETL